MNAIFPIAHFDSPQILDTTVTPIPAATGSPMQVVADLGFRASFAIDFIDSTGDFIGVYTGGVGQEQLNCIIGGGVNQRAWSVIPAHSRVSLRSMTTSAITNGRLVCTFMGMGPGAI